MKGRLAPTPSGLMHLGNALSALLCWLSARSQGGSLLLRIEDLDLLRTSPLYTEAILEDLIWLGLDWDEGPFLAGESRAAHGAGALASHPGFTTHETPSADVLTPLAFRGENGPYLQSERSSFYGECVTKLAARGLIYPCFCSRAELHAATAPHASDGSYVYSGACRRLSPSARRARQMKKPGALRVEVPDETVTFTDGCQGEAAQNLRDECGDFILRRSDGVYAYQLAAPADDGAMGVSEVVRGRDLLPSAPRQIWLMQKLGYTPPRFCHTPMLLAGDGRRLSKRDGDLTLTALREKGVPAEEVVGLLAHLCGLLPKKEPATARELVAGFDWGRVRKEDILLRDEDIEALPQAPGAR